MKNKIVLLNADNTDCSANVLLGCMNLFEKAYVFFSSTPLMLDYSTLAQLIPFIKSERLHFIEILEVDEIGDVGENSIEFAIACIAGQLSTSLPKKSTIEIRSNNSMSLSIVNLLKTLGIRVEIINNKALKKRSENKSDDENELEIDVVPYVLDISDISGESFNKNYNSGLIDDGFNSEFNQGGNLNFKYLISGTEIELTNKSLNKNLINYSISLQDKLNIHAKKKPRKYITEIINNIKILKFYRKDIDKNIINNLLDTKENPVNTVYKYMMIYFQNVELKKLDSRGVFISYFHQEHYLTEQSASQLLNYLISCQLILTSRNKLRMKIGTLEQLETLNTDLHFI